MVKPKLLLRIFLLTILTSDGYAQYNDTLNLISPSTIKLDLDNLKFLTHGVIAVSKGTEEALIDVKGNFIVPWGKYKNYDYNFIWGDLIRVEDPRTMLGGFINTKGKVIIPLENTNIVSYFNHFGLSRFHKVVNDHKLYAIDTKGNVLPGNEVLNQNNISHVYLRELYTEPQNTTRILMGRMIDVTDTTPANVYTQGKSGRMGQLKDGRNTFTYKKMKYEYGTKNGKVLLSVNFDIARQFTNGMAAVMKVDAFGAMKWGFIDTTGKLKIPLVFSNEPGYFHYGLALVEPIDKLDFKFAYIDKLGEIKIKIGSTDKNVFYKTIGGYGHTVVTSGFFIHGYAFWERDGIPIVLDTLGNFIPFHEFVHRPDLFPNPLNPKKDIISIDFNDLGISFWTYDKGNGFMDYNRNLLFPYIPGSIKPDYYSSYALLEIKNDIQKQPEYGHWLQGIIGKDGKLILLKEKKNIF